MVPKERREQVFTLAHSTGCSGHLRAYKTTLRIKMSYFWPGMSKRIKHWCTECKDCQLKARRRTDDRVLISPIATAPVPFHTMNIDVTESLTDKVPYPLRMCNDEPLPCERIPPDAVSHVNECERTESVRKSFKDDKIPPVVREKVDRQIDQLREWGVIEPSDSHMATPIVCALRTSLSD